MSKAELISWEDWDIEGKILKARQILPGPGRGKRGKSKDHGFPLIEEESLSILELIDKGVYPEIVEGIAS